MVATGSLDGIVKVWETQTGKLVASLEGPQKEIEVKFFIYSFC
jgi:WD40 repeat protein